MSEPCLNIQRHDIEHEMGDGDAGGGVFLSIDTSIGIDLSINLSIDMCIRPVFFSRHN
jgi:hypothetical protein